MKRIRKLMIVFVLFIIAPSIFGADLEKERAAILKVDKEWATVTAEGRDVDHIVSFWADDATVFPPGSPAVRGKDSIRQFVEKSLQTPGFSIHWETSDVIVSHDGKFAYAIGKNQTTFNDPQGRRVTLHGKAVTVWRKEPSDVWKCVIDIWNEDPPLQK